MTENDLQSRVLKRLRALGGHWINVHGGAFQRPGVFDIIGCFEGRFVAIELKRPYKYKDPKAGLTPAQWSFRNQIASAGGLVFVADNEDVLLEELASVGIRRHP